jgi:hypothetical protein
MSGLLTKLVILKQENKKISGHLNTGTFLQWKTEDGGYSCRNALVLNIMAD